jgi:hypothetical protein
MKRFRQGKAVEWEIRRFYGAESECWDGPFKTEREARARMKNYDGMDTKLVRVTYQLLDHRTPHPSAGGSK